MMTYLTPQTRIRESLQNKVCVNSSSATVDYSIFANTVINNI
jgi:hypothetical protein